ncbi:fatty acid-binding protein FABP [Pochonia chlamydosporia 170]|uniref:Fatty acid-binding protein FABP n=1 Tax=Pochonia chlamydosporia 170 TaxID=1380566 RepID=A0A179FBT8_METCM|nr:fatty acid-binding protein FABP [Pochonia chlamydosporia 170]OAQ62888.1 fatty acid-binding protein FABP [Pochonia chlamydosporia 170]
MDNFYGSWTQESCDNVDAFLNALKIGFVLRTAAKTQTPTVEFSVEGDEITMKTITTFKTDEVKFELGKEFPEKRLDGVLVQTTAVIQNGALVFHKEGDKPYTVTFAIEDGKLKATYAIGNVVATRILKKN